MTTNYQEEDRINKDDKVEYIEEENRINKDERVESIENRKEQNQQIQQIQFRNKTIKYKSNYVSNCKPNLLQITKYR